MNKIRLKLIETAFDRSYNDAEIFCTLHDLPRTSYTWVWLAGPYRQIAITRHNPFEPTDDPNIWLATPEQLEQAIKDYDMNKHEKPIGAQTACSVGIGPTEALKKPSLMERLDQTSRAAEGALHNLLELRDRLEGVMKPTQDDDSSLAKNLAHEPDPTLSIRRVDEIDRTISAIIREIAIMMDRLVL